MCYNYIQVFPHPVLNKRIKICAGCSILTEKKHLAWDGICSLVLMLFPNLPAVYHYGPHVLSPGSRGLADKCEYRQDTLRHTHIWPLCVVVLHYRPLISTTFLRTLGDGERNRMAMGGKGGKNNLNQNRKDKANSYIWLEQKVWKVWEIKILCMIVPFLHVCFV